MKDYKWIRKITLIRLKGIKIRNWDVNHNNFLIHALTNPPWGCFTKGVNLDKLQSDYSSAITAGLYRCRWLIRSCR